MPRRWATETRAWAYRYLVLRDGEFCQLCHKIPTTFYGLDIDHVDGDKNNNRESNLRLLCRRCNVSLENKRRAVSPSVHGERENQRTRIVKGAVAYGEGMKTFQPYVASIVGSSYLKVSMRISALGCLLRPRLLL